MTFLAGFYALVAALLGASIWAGITYVTGYQIGFMAIGMGALIGAGVRLGEGEGKAAALFAGGLSLVAMFLGDVMAVQIALDKAIDEVAAEAFSQEAYKEEFAIADKFVLYTPEDSYAEFIVENTYYSEAESPEDVTDAEIQDFLNGYAPELRRLHQERPTYQTWRDRKAELIRQEFMEGVGTTQFVIENIGIIGVVFIFLGLFTAVRVVGEWD